MVPFTLLPGEGVLKEELCIHSTLNVKHEIPQEKDEDTLYIA